MGVLGSPLGFTDKIISRPSSNLRAVPVAPPPPTSAVLQRRLHGAPPLVQPAALGRTQVLHVLRRTPLPQIDLQAVVEQEQGCRTDKRDGDI